MSDQETYAKSVIPQVIAEGQTLQAIGRSIFSLPIQTSLDNAADFMAMAFVTKQLEHVQTIEGLVGMGIHRDTELISRVVIEGFIQLAWAFARNIAIRVERTGRWLAYEFVALRGKPIRDVQGGPSD